MFLFLWSICIYGWIIFRRTEKISQSELWRLDALNFKNLSLVFIRWIICSIFIIIFTYFFDPERLFYLVKNRPEIIPSIMIGYPIASALPQEFIFCTFFFARYRVFFQSDKAIVLASAIVFAYAHVLYINPIAPIFSFFGGLIFAHTYLKTKSLALVTIEHGLYGNALFVIGLGWYFFHGYVH
nr:CPBP family intramembrane metalloprotease [Cytophagales bacterium]